MAISQCLTFVLINEKVHLIASGVFRNAYALYISTALHQMFFTQEVHFH